MYKCAIDILVLRLISRRAKDMEGVIIFSFGCEQTEYIAFGCKCLMVMQSFYNHRLSFAGFKAGYENQQKK